MTTTLTICIATYNRWDLCLRSLRALVRSCHLPSNIIVVDDSSLSKPSNFFLHFLRTHNIHLIRHRKNLGLPSARNSALNITETEFFSFCDDDDIWPSTLASNLTSALSNAPPYVGMAILLDKSRMPNDITDLSSYPYLSDLMRKGLTPPVSSQIYRTSLLKTVGGYRSHIQSGVDHDLWVSLARIGTRACVIWGEPAHTPPFTSHKRMTNNESHRRSSITSSLSIWRSDIVETFGEGFYKHFCFSYQQYLDRTFFLSSISNMCWREKVISFFQNPFSLIIYLKYRYHLRRLASSPFLFPPYKP